MIRAVIRVIRHEGRVWPRNVAKVCSESVDCLFLGLEAILVQWLFASRPKLCFPTSHNDNSGSSISKNGIWPLTTPREWEIAKENKTETYSEMHSFSQSFAAKFIVCQPLFAFFWRIFEHEKEYIHFCSNSKSFGPFRAENRYFEQF